MQNVNQYSQYDEFPKMKIYLKSGEMDQLLRTLIVLGEAPASVARKFLYHMTQSYHSQVLGIYPKDPKPIYHRDTCPSTLMQSYRNNLGVHQQRNLQKNAAKIHNIPNRILLSYKEESYVIFKKQIQLKIIVLSKLSQSQKDKYCLFSYIVPMFYKLHTVMC